MKKTPFSGVVGQHNLDSMFVVVAFIYFLCFQKICFVFKKLKEQEVAGGSGKDLRETVIKIHCEKFKT